MARDAARPGGLTVVVTSTPGTGGPRLAELLASTGGFPAPMTCFEPLRVPNLARRWSVARGGDDWAARYSAAALRAATRGGVSAIHMTWTHARWLIGVSRRQDDDRSDAEIVADCLPGPRYLHLEGSDPAHEALCWYLSQHPGTGGPEAVRDGTAPAPDFQEVRWLEAIVSRHAQAWDTYFAIHGIEEHRIDVSCLRRDPAPAIAGALAWLGVAGDRDPVAGPAARGPVQRCADQWLPRYMLVRRRLNGVVGVRSPRP